MTWVAAIDQYSNTTNNDHHTWFWQKCSEFRFFKFPDERLQYVVEYNQAMCMIIFNVSFPADFGASATNAKYAGFNNNATNVYFVNGDLDPWQHLLIQVPNNEHQFTAVIPNTSHCEDMYGTKYNALPHI